MSIIPVALSFWLLGTIVLAFGQRDSLVYLFFLFCQATTIILGLGAASSYAPTWGWWLFGLLLWWIGPLTFHTHLALSASDGSKLHIRFLYSVYFFALVFTCMDLIRLNLEIAGPMLTFKYLWVGAFILSSAGHLISTSLRRTSVEHQRRTRIAGISALVAIMPFVFFSLIPDAFTGKFILPYEITFLALPIIPLGYCYAILRYRLVRIERVISQSAARALAIFMIIILYGFVYIFTSNSFPRTGTHYSIFELVTLLSMVFSAHPIYQGLYRWIYLVFYGGWSYERLAVNRISQDLKHVKGDTYSIAQTLCQTLQRTMRLEYVNLLLSDGCLITTNKEGSSSNEALSFHAQQVMDLFDKLREKTDSELGPGEELKEFLSTVGFENWQLLGQRPQLWLLFGGSRNWQGLLVLGSKYGRGDFEAKDLEILEVVLRQAGAALENERLLEEVRQRSNQIRDLSRKVMWTREVERKRIARDLHDLVIQTLVGINFQLSSFSTRHHAGTAGELQMIRNNLQESLVELRGICADLRPPALDALGLVPALEARVTEISSQVPFEISLKSSGLEEDEISDEIALCVYRFFQEALMNVQKHSDAGVVMVHLHTDSDHRLQLIIEDDGRGFDAPERLEMLVTQQHFGLVGLREQVEAVGGQMQIEAGIGQGCRLIANLPLNLESAHSQPGI
jgi:signal transduction histidine kinase